MIANLTRELLLEGRTALGCFVRTSDASFAEFAATRGWDFLVFDGEHGLATSTDVANLARACEVRGVTPIVRVPTTERSVVLRCLDAGVAGIHFPWISHADEAATAVSLAKYGPVGTRGLAGNRSTDWSVSPEATANANEQTLIVVQIETTAAVQDIEQICSVDGVDVLFVGPSDLSQSLGVPGDFTHPRLVGAMEEVAAAVHSSGKILGLYAGTPQAAEAGMALGARYVATGIEPLLGPAMEAFISAVSPA